ncbi:DMT family transporter [Luteimonas composti]|uniref:DMT family transporter n=1 Tax=Luteimonas composti TaxID=398257 RepID=A0ABT6MNH3_9GAMM|nr:DMT family transporter [Luteimonas composti]MDH7451983.1 DMT family transporter [Luteimonas composti]
MKAWIPLGIVAVVFAGALLPLQALINARLGALTQGALYASFVSFLVGTCLLGALLLASRTALLPQAPLSALPPWIWLGGAIGASLVLASTLMVPRIGAGALVCLIVLGQVLGALLLDHFGVLGAQRAADPLRIGGAVLVLAGAVLVMRPWQSA